MARADSQAAREANCQPDATSSESDDATAQDEAPSTADEKE